VRRRRGRLDFSQHQPGWGAHGAGRINGQRFEVEVVHADQHDGHRDLPFGRGGRAVGWLGPHRLRV
jgi:hypothetical protein